MSQVLIDANVLIAARLTRDQDHDRGLAIAEAIDHGRLPTAFVISDVLEEVIHYLQARSTHDVAVETFDALIESSGIEIGYTPKVDFDAGRSLFRRYESLSLTDSIIVASMTNHKIEYLYSFDEGFDAGDGITRLTTTDNPFH